MHVVERREARVPHGQRVSRRRRRVHPVYFQESQLCQQRLSLGIAEGGHEQLPLCAGDSGPATSGSVVPLTAERVRFTDLGEPLEQDSRAQRP